MSDRFEQIEVRIAYLEQANAELSDALIRQQQEIKALREQLGSMTQRFEAAQSAPTTYTLEDEKPPHY
jgi:uncharacterized coiled-coil protein SlyX